MDNFNERTVKGYQLLKLIGSGGFGAVYQAHQAIVDREVAIKVILPHHANDPNFIRNFEAEAHLIARLEHPFVVPLYDFWRDHEGAYLVMRYYQSGNLSQLIHQGGSLDHETIARMLEQIASALDTAHAANIIHRDIKPANILLDATGNAYLSDFGLAEELGDDVDSADMAGSPAYLSPEVIKNETPGPKSDLYSLGFVLYEMLTGRYAFSEITPDSSIMSILDFHLNEHIPDVLELSDAINLVIQRATAKDPEDRYPNAMSMAMAFRRAISDDIADLPETITVSSEFIVNPYKGLRSFDEADEFTFFGRDKLVKRLLEGLGENSSDSNFLALVGPSGSGKSSVVRAGLIPAIRRGELGNGDNWFILDMIPGATPFKQLVATLRSISLDSLAGAERTLKSSASALQEMLPKILPTPDSKLLLVIDQFEELFTQTDDQELRRHFLDLLYTSLQSDNFYLVIMLRADFYDRPMMHDGFGQLIQARTQVVLPLTSVELHNVITRPAEHAGLQVESDLTAAIVADLQSEAVALPLLQYALTEVFERRDENKLSLDNYREIGGIAGALAHRADEIYDGLATPLKEITRQIFLRFVTPGEGTEDTRRRARRSELLSVVRDNQKLQEVLDAFGKARLLTFDNDEESREPTVEVAHEALIREWGRLRNWLDDSREDIRRQRILNATVQQWLDADRDNSFLLRGMQLLQIEDWLASSSVKPGEVEDEFLATSIAERERIETIEAERLEHEARLEAQSRQRLQYLLGVFAIAAVVAGVLSIFAFTQANAARDARDIALANELEAEANRLEAEENADEAEANRLEAEANADEAEANRLEAEANAVIAQEAAAEARSIALASAALNEYSEGRAELALALALDAVDIDTALLDAPPELAYEALVEVSHAPGVVYEEAAIDRVIEHLVISPDGRYAIFGSGKNASSYWTLAGQGEGDRPPQGNRPPGAGNGPPGNPPPAGRGDGPPENRPSDGPPAPDGRLHVWDIDGRNLQREFVAHETFITDIVLTMLPDGTQILVSSSEDGQVIFWDYETGTIRHELSVSAGFLVLSPSDNGETILIAANGMNNIPGTMLLLDTATTETLAEYPVPPNLALARMTADGNTIVGLTLDGDIISWDARNGEEIMRTNIQTSLRPNAIEILVSPDNRTVAVNTGGDTIPLFDLVTGQSRGVVVPSAPGTHRATFNDDGSQMLALSRDGIVTVWDIEGQFFVRDFRTLVSMPTTITWQSANDVAIVTPRGGFMRLYSIEGADSQLIDTIGNEQAAQSEWLSDTEILLAYRRGGSELVAWNLETNEERLIATTGFQQYSISLSPDKQFVTVVPESAPEGFLLVSLDGETVSPCAFCESTTPNPVRAIFLNSSPNRIVVADAGSVNLWELETQSEIWQTRPGQGAIRQDSFQ